MLYALSLDAVDISPRVKDLCENIYTQLNIKIRFSFSNIHARHVLNIFFKRRIFLTFCNKSQWHEMVLNRLWRHKNFSSSSHACGIILLRESEGFSLKKKYEKGPLEFLARSERRNIWTFYECAIARYVKSARTLKWFMNI